MTVAFAVLAAFCNAVNVVTQHIASTEAPKATRGLRLVVQLFRSPLWLFGWIAIAGAFVFQALALHEGELSVVQPLLIGELVFTLVLRRVWLHQHIATVAWVAGAAIVVGLWLFLLAAEPHGGVTHPSARSWVSATVVWGTVSAVLVLVGHRVARSARAALYAAGTAVGWALVAAYMKQTTQAFSDFGVAAFGHWPPYALAASGLLAEVLTQMTLHAGPLTVSQPFLVILDPLVSIVLSVWIFREYFTSNAPAIALGCVSLAGASVAVWVLIRTAPMTMERGAST